MGNQIIFVIGNKSLERERTSGAFYWIVKASDGTKLKTEVTANPTIIKPTAALFHSRTMNTQNTVVQVDGITFRECRKIWMEGHELVVNGPYFQYRVELSRTSYLVEQWNIESQGLLHFSHCVYVLNRNMFTSCKDCVAC
jgi:hypothetical protein